MEHLAHATREQARTPDKKLGAILLELGFIDQRQLAQLLEAQKQYLAKHPGNAPAPAPQARPAPPAAPGVPPPPKRGRAPAPERRPSPPRVVSPQAQAQVEWLHRVLQRGVSMDASDIHLHSGTQVKVRVYGALLDMTQELMRPEQVEAALLPSMEDWQREQYLEDGEVDYSYTVPHVGRFRVNVYKQHSGPCGVYHFIPADPPELADLGLPNTAARLVNHQNGIVLITGPSGSGKTSTMAALINLINEERADHVLSIEDPIEYLHPSKRCIVNQRQVNRHTKSFADALKSALREDPDVICIGELRDLETISLALSAAETGHLVLGTLHTQGAIRTINRIVGAYPPAQQPQVRTMLSESLRAIISQKLLPRADRTGVALAYELMLCNNAASNLIRENRTFQLTSILQTGRAAGMRSMDDSIEELLERSLIHHQDAVLHAEDKRRFGPKPSTEGAPKQRKRAR